MKAMILAAGRGKRLRPFTDEIPKPLLKIGQFSLIEHLILHLRQQGFHEIVVNVAYLKEKIVNALGTGEKYGVTIHYSPEQQEGLGTGGGILNAMPLLGDSPFLVVSADIWTNYPFSCLRDKPLDSLAHLIMVDNFAESKDGDFCLINGRLHASQGTRLTYASMGVYHPEFFSDCSPGFFKLGPLLHKAVGDNQITGEYFQGDWENVGTPETLISLRKRVTENCT